MSYIRTLFIALMLCLGSAGIMAAPLDINTADAETLAATLTGVGSSKAKKIVSYRDEHGPFSSIEDLLNVKGIGESTLDKNQDKITVGEGSSQ